MINIAGVGAYFGAECEKRGMLVRVAGDNIMMCPPFIITPEEIDQVRDSFYPMSINIIRLQLDSFSTVKHNSFRVLPDLAIYLFHFDISNSYGHLCFS